MVTRLVRNHHRAHRRRKITIVAHGMPSNKHIAHALTYIYVCSSVLYRFHNRASLTVTLVYAVSGDGVCMLAGIPRVCALRHAALYNASLTRFSMARTASYRSMQYNTIQTNPVTEWGLWRQT